ncbi:MAG: glycosyltransferase, partial [Geobacteraceae bacterium]|nr:glycosyltransferase [Geobacteraceae bacterium]
VANLWPVKNHDGLLRTLRNMPGDWRLAMIGHPSDNMEYVKLVRQEASLDSRVILIPGLSREDVASAMDAADIFLLASHGEVSPVTILEAMSHGIPWLATPECGSIRDFAGGLITPLQEFPATLKLLLTHRNIRIALGEAGQRHWQSCFTWDVVMPAWSQLIQTGSTAFCFEIPDDVSASMVSIGRDPSLYSLNRAPVTPFVSVIVPTHNRPELLAKALRSIQDQTFRDFEIIVVNDAGIDVSRLVEHFDSKGTIHYINKETNEGLAAARNSGIRAARGKYLAYLDDDDIYYPDHLQTLTDFLENSDSLVAYSDALRALQEQKGETFTTVKRDIPYCEEFDADRLLVENYIPVLCVMHERKCLDQIGLFDETLPRHEDWDLWIRMSQEFPFVHIPKVTAEFTHRNTDPSGMTSGTLPSMLATLEKVYEKSASLTASKPMVVARRKSYLFDMKNRIHGFLRDKLEALLDTPKSVNDPEEHELLGQLHMTGATSSQILAAYYHTLGLQHISDDPVSALAYFSRALTADPVCCPVHRSIAETLLQIGETEKAVRHCEVILSQEPGDPELIEIVAAMSRQIGNLTRGKFWDDKAKNLRQEMRAP